MMTTGKTVLRVRPRRRAAPAPPLPAEALAERAARSALPDEIDSLCQAWARWCATRRYFGPPAGLPSVLGSLHTRTVMATDGSGGRNAFCSREIACFHLAVLAGGEGKDRLVFEAHYRLRPASIKAAASALGIGRQHWYTLRNGFARRAWSAHAQLMKVSPPQATTFRVTAGDTLAQNPP